MQASASTWIYNIVLDLAPVLLPDRAVKGVFIAYRGKLAQVQDPTIKYVVKSHGVNDATAAGLSEHAQSIIISIRDPRDAVASLVTYHSTSFREALYEVELAADSCARFAHDKRTILLRYETRFTEQPETIDRIATVFGKPVAAEVRDRLFNNSRREVIDRLISGLESRPTAKRDGEDVFDAERQWHKVHAGRTGAVGKWRSILTDRQVARIELRMQDWMRDFGYEPSQKPDIVDRVVDLVDRVRAA